MFKSIGLHLKFARESQGVSISELSRQTRIKTEFLEDLEKEKWEKLPEFTILSGFVKSVSDALSLNRDQSMAILRRDYPKKTIQKSTPPPPAIVKRKKIGPRFFFFVFTGIFTLAFLGYLVYQYRSFTSPPEIKILAPQEGDTITSRKVTVRGSTDSSSSVLVNNQPAYIDKDGNFVTEIEISGDTSEIEVKALSRANKESIKRIKFFVKL